MLRLDFASTRWRTEGNLSSCTLYGYIIILQVGIFSVRFASKGRGKP